MSIALACVGSNAAACPNCEPGRQARQEFWRNDFMINLAAATLPLVIVLAVSECAHELWRRKSMEGPEPAEQVSRKDGSEAPMSSPSTLRGA